MSTQTDLNFIISCLYNVLRNCMDTCGGFCDCKTEYDKAVKIVTEWAAKI